jgi:hypothetical protein
MTFSKIKLKRQKAKNKDDHAAFTVIYFVLLFKLNLCGSNINTGENADGDNTGKPSCTPARTAGGQAGR